LEKIKKPLLLMNTTWIWIIIGVIVIVALLYFLKKQRGGSGMPKRPTGPESGIPPEGPAM